MRIGPFVALFLPAMLCAQDRPCAASNGLATE
jgi:hypothetical protein